MKKQKKILLSFKSDNYIFYHNLKEKLNKIEKETGENISFSAYVINLIKKDLED
jgi:hypothetical protein